MGQHTRRGGKYNGKCTHVIEAAVPVLAIVEPLPEVEIISLLPVRHVSTCEPRSVNFHFDRGCIVLAVRQCGKTQRIQLKVSDCQRVMDVLLQSGERLKKDDISIVATTM